MHLITFSLSYTRNISPTVRANKLHFSCLIKQPPLICVFLTSPVFCLNVSYNGLVNLLYIFFYPSIQCLFLEFIFSYLSPRSRTSCLKNQELFYIHFLNKTLTFGISRGRINYVIKKLEII